MKSVAGVSLLLSVLAAWTVADAHGQGSFFSIPSPWVWACQDSRCVRQERSGVNADSTSSLPACKLTCNEFSVLWPRPRGTLTLSRTLVTFGADQFHVAKISAPSKQTEDLVKGATDLLAEKMRQMMGDVGDSPCPRALIQRKVHLHVSITSDEAVLQMSTDESYTLTIQSQTGDVTWIHVVAPTFFGARHGLETLSQLMAWDDSVDAYLLMSDATVTDSPAFAHRGLLVDTSRNYINVATLKRIIDAMSFDRLNVFHWHMTDTHSFPFVSRREPLLAVYGAYSPSKVYRPQDIQDIVRYATVRGVKVLPEFDAPAHVGAGWQWGEKYGMGQLALCVDSQPWEDYCVEPPCGQLNPINDNIYRILGNIYADMAELFQSDVFHMGGDEVHFRCWNETTEIVSWLAGRGYGTDKSAFLYLWSQFQNRSLEQLDRVSKVRQPIVLWTSGLTEEGHADQYLDPERYIIQIWTNATDPQIADLYTKGYRLIMSNYDAWYLDCGYGAWVGNGSNNWCSPYIGWQRVYTNSPRQIIDDLGLDFDYKRVLGGETALWSEQVDSSTIEGKLWPRMSAFAERMWTDPDSGWHAAESRFIHHRQRLVQRGVMADRLQPEWCHQNEGSCFL